VPLTVGIPRNLLKPQVELSVCTLSINSGTEYTMKCPVDLENRQIKVLNNPNSQQVPEIMEGSVVQIKIGKFTNPDTP